MVFTSVYTYVNKIIVSRINKQRKNFQDFFIKAVRFRNTYYSNIFRQENHHSTGKFTSYCYSCINVIIMSIIIISHLDLIFFKFNHRSAYLQGSG